MTLKEKREYLVTSLKASTKELAKAAKDKNVQQLIVAKANEKFDGDYNVLLKDLLKVPTIASKVNVANVNNTFKAFQGIEGNNYYPQIYIPYLSNSLNRVETNTEDVEYIFYDGDEEALTAPAWELDVNNEFVLNGRIIDEQYALTHNVLIISLSEAVDDDGTLPIDFYPPPPPPANPYNINVKIENLGINCMKEGWIGGKADVCIRAYRYTWNLRKDGNPSGDIGEYLSLRSTNDLRGIQIRRFDKSETSNGLNFNLINVNFPLQDNWGIGSWYTFPIVYGYVIFEKDNWPAGVKKHEYTPNFANPSVNREIKYRSNNQLFFGGSFYASNQFWPSNVNKPNHEYWNNFSSYSTLREIKEENSCIKFNVIQY